MISMKITRIGVYLFLPLTGNFEYLISLNYDSKIMLAIHSAWHVVVVLAPCDRHLLELGCLLTVERKLLSLQ